MDALVGEAGAGVVGDDRLPARGAAADLLGELALRGLQRLLAVLVEPPGRDLEQVRLADRLARLAHEPDLALVVGEHPDGAAVAHDLPLDDFAVGVAEALDAHVEDAPGVDRLAAERLERRAASSSRLAAAVAGSSPGPAWSAGPVPNPSGASSASAAPPASAAPKNSGSSARLRPIVSAGSPLAA